MYEICFKLPYNTKTTRFIKARLNGDINIIIIIILIN